MTGNTNNPRSPGKVRARREFAAFFSDEIPTRDDSSPARNRRSSAGNSLCQRHESRSVSPIQRHDSGRSKSQVTPSTRSFSEDRTLVHNKPKSFVDTSSEDFADQITPSRSKPSVMVSSSTESFSIVSRNIYNLWQNQQLCDVKLSAGGRQFLVHKLVMASYCGVFRKEREARSTSITTELSIPDVSADAMNDVLKFFYTHQLRVSGHNVDSMLKIAKDLNIHIITEKCKEYLLDINLKNVLHNRCIAHKYGLCDIAKVIDEFFRQNFVELACSSAFLQREFEEVYDIISSGNFVIGSALDIFHACVAWIDFNRKSRLKYAVPLMGLVRFVHIHPEKIVSEIEPIQYIFEISECKEMLYRAFKHHALLHECMTMPITTSSQPCKQQKMGTSSSNQNSLSEYCSNPCSKQAVTPSSQSFPRPHACHSVRATKDEMCISRSSSFNETKSITDLPAPPGLQIILVMGGLNSFEFEESGVNSAGGISQVVQQYDPTTNSWSCRSTLPLPLHHCGVVSLDGHAYVMGGTRMGFHDDIKEVSPGFYRYDVVNNDWSNLARLLTPRSEHAALTLNNVIYAVGGVDNEGNSLNSMEFYNLEEDKWYYTSSMNDVRTGLAAVGHAGRVFVVGGTIGTEQRYLLDSVESYNPATNTWTQLSSFPLAICHAGLADVSDVLYLVGGHVAREGDSILSLDSIFRYRDDADMWEPFISLHIPRHDATLVSLKSRLYVIGGISSATIGHALSNVECFDVETHDRIEGVAPLPTPAYGLCGCAV